jgi:hypothetical protein
MTKFMTEDMVDVLVGVLPKFIIDVDFKKTNGENRHMRCTKNPKFIQARLEAKYPDGVPETTHHKAPNPDVVAVWDVDKDAYRSFRKDSVISYSIVS